MKAHTFMLKHNSYWILLWLGCNRLRTETQPSLTKPINWMIINFCMQVRPFRNNTAIYDGSYYSFLFEDLNWDLKCFKSCFYVLLLLLRDLGSMCWILYFPSVSWFSLNDSGMVFFQSRRNCLGCVLGGFQQFVEMFLVFWFYAWNWVCLR